MSDQSLTDWYRSQITQLGTELGNAHGWKKRVAERLGISPGYLSKVMSGERQVGLDVALRAVQRLGLDPRVLRGFDGVLTPEPPASTYSSDVALHAAQRAIRQIAHDEPVAVEDSMLLAEAVMAFPWVQAARRIIAGNGSRGDTILVAAHIMAGARD